MLCIKHCPPLGQIIEVVGEQIDFANDNANNSIPREFSQRSYVHPIAFRKIRSFAEHSHAHGK